MMSWFLQRGTSDNSWFPFFGTRGIDTVCWLLLAWDWRSGATLWEHTPSLAPGHTPSTACRGADHGRPMTPPHPQWMPLSLLVNGTQREKHNL